MSTMACEQQGKCKCASTLRGKIECKARDYLSMENNICLTWNDKIDSIRASYCLYIPMDHKTCKKSHYKIIANLSGPELDKQMCGKLNC